MDDRSSGRPAGAAISLVKRGVDSSARAAGRLRLALTAGAAIWLLLLVVGFFVPGGWVWGMAGPIGHMENYMISLWLVGLVLAPLLASRDPLHRTPAVQVYLLALVAIAVSTVRGEQLKWIADAPPLAAVVLCVGAVIATHPERSALFQL
jgi:hypothetical protein